MPRRVVAAGRRWRSDYYQEILLVLLSLVLVIAIWGWLKAANVQSTVGADKRAREEALKTDQVVTCFSTARNRPRLLLILESLAEREPDPGVRIAIQSLIQDYRAQPVPGVQGEPTRAKCKSLARMLEVDDRAYDFDPETGRLLHPEATA